MSTARVLVRADAGTTTGAGHVVRCLSVGTELRRRGADVRFAVRAPAVIVDRIRTAGFAADVLPPIDRTTSSRIWAPADQVVDARQVMESRHPTGDPDIVVVDHYGLDATWEHAIRRGDRRIVVIDDLADRRHHCDLLIDQNWYGIGTAARYDQLVEHGCRRLLGPRYAMLQPQYHATRRARTAIRWPPERLLVSFGGTDPARETDKVLRALRAERFRRLAVDVVVGAADRVTDEVERLARLRSDSTLHVAVPSLAQLLAAVDLAIGASGAGTWERLCLGVFGVVATVSPGQSGVAAALAAEGATDWIGLVSETTESTYADAIDRWRTARVPNVPAIVDGQGAARVAEGILASPVDRVVTRPAHERDVPVFTGLEAEATGQGRGLLDGPSAWTAEADRWSRRLAAGSGDLRVVEAAGAAIGGVETRADGSTRVMLVDAVTDRDLDLHVLHQLEHAVSVAPDRPPRRGRRGTYAEVGAERDR